MTLETFGLAILGGLLPVGVLVLLVWLWKPSLERLRALEQRLRAGGPVQRDYRALRERVQDLEGQVQPLQQQVRALLLRIQGLERPWVGNWVGNVGTHEARSLEDGQILAILRSSDWGRLFERYQGAEVDQAYLRRIIHLGEDHGINMRVLREAFDRTYLRSIGGAQEASPPPIPMPPEPEVPREPRTAWDHLKDG